MGALWGFTEILVSGAQSRLGDWERPWLLRNPWAFQVSHHLGGIQNHFGAEHKIDMSEHRQVKSRAWLEYHSLISINIWPCSIVGADSISLIVTAIIPPNPYWVHTHPPGNLLNTWGVLSLPLGWVLFLLAMWQQGRLRQVELKFLAWGLMASMMGLVLEFWRSGPGMRSSLFCLTVLVLWSCRSNLLGKWPRRNNDCVLPSVRPFLRKDGCWVLVPNVVFWPLHMLWHVHAWTHT